MTSRLIQFAMVICFFLQTASAVHCGQSQVIVIAEDPWPPFTFGSYGPTNKGIAVDILRELFGRLDVKISLQLFPWKRVLKSVETGKIDGVMMLKKIPERESYLEYTNPIFTSYERLYFKPAKLGEFKWNSFEDLKPYRICLINGYTYDKDFISAVNTLKLNIILAQTVEQALMMLHAERFDLAVMDEVVARYQIGRNPQWASSLRESRAPVGKVTYHMAFSRYSPARKLIPEINRMLDEMKSDGAIDKILLKKY